MKWTNSSKRNICPILKTQLIYLIILAAKEEKSCDYIIGAETAFYKIQYPFMIKTLGDLGIEGKCPTKIRRKRRISSLTTLIQHSSESCSQRKKEMKGTQIRKDLFLFADNRKISGNQQ